MYLDFSIVNICILIFTISFSSPTSRLLLTVSANQLTGTVRIGFWVTQPLTFTYIPFLQIPTRLFTNSSIKIVGLAKNCLHGEIPIEACSAQNLTVVIMNALSQGCSKVSRMTGSIPTCLFTLPNIKSIYLSSNNLQGELPGDILVSSQKLVNLSVSYNKMDGVKLLYILNTS